VVADGSEGAARRLARVLKSDPGMGIVRHVDAGYDDALAFAHAHHVAIPGKTVLTDPVSSTWPGGEG
jgi:urocanate hydratase